MRDGVPYSWGDASAKPMQPSVAHRPVNRFAAVLLALLAMAAGAPDGKAAEAGAGTPLRPLPADVPEPRTDANSLEAHRQLLEKRHRGRIEVYFIGDSITRRWGAAEPRYRALLEHWQKSFHGWNAANFAWGADTTRNMLWRLDQGELDGVNPRVIVVMAGTNNLRVPADEADGERLAADVARGIAAILERCRRLAPEARIVLMGITPRTDDMRHLPVIRQVNARLAQMADGERIRFIDLWDRLADEEGRLYPGMTDPDLLHLALPAYEIWAQSLRPVLTEWLGPPAAQDHAPPPTGDPSAMRAN
jgi:lysophospholipase L1-like esterase